MVDCTLQSARQDVEDFIEILRELASQLYYAGQNVWCCPYTVIGGSLVVRVVVRAQVAGPKSETGEFVRRGLPPRSSVFGFQLINRAPSLENISCASRYRELVWRTGII
jgi:hypothetical protein